METTKGEDTTREEGELSDDGEIIENIPVKGKKSSKVSGDSSQNFQTFYAFCFPM